VGEAKFHHGRHLKPTEAFRHCFANAPKQQNTGQHVGQKQIKHFCLRTDAEEGVVLDGVNCQKYMASVVYELNMQYGSLVG
jgi:hypothetical protein